MNYRDRHLLDLAHRVECCQNCLRATPDGCEPAHENGPASGKGMGIKAPDNRVAALCHECHAWYDQGGAKRDPSGHWEGTREDKMLMWNAAHKRTYDLYWRNGWLAVV